VSWKHTDVLTGGACYGSTPLGAIQTLYRCISVWTATRNGLCGPGVIPLLGIGGPGPYPDPVVRAVSIQIRLFQAVGSSACCSSCSCWSSWSWPSSSTRRRYCDLFCVYPCSYYVLGYVPLICCLPHKQRQNIRHTHIRSNPRTHIHVDREQKGTKAPV
jgi:hypothetical protein